MSLESRKANVLPMVVMAGLFVLINILALLLAGPFKEAGQVAFVDSSDPYNIVYFFTILIVFTAAILIIAKYGKEKIIQGIILASTGILDIFVFYPLLNIVLPLYISVGIAITIAAVIVTLLIKYPEWYVINISAIITGVGAMAMLGISLDIILVIILLSGMAIYDAISVYKTKHMIDLADTLVDLKLPILFVVPKTRDYSLIEDQKRLKDKLKEGEKRDAFLLGAGDIILPGILSVAAFHTLPSNGFLVAMCVVIGTLIGFAMLMTFVLKGKPQAGLPFLCPGAILGYVISTLILFGGIPGITIFF